MSLRPSSPPRAPLWALLAAACAHPGDDCPGEAAALDVAEEPLCFEHLESEHLFAYPIGEKTDAAVSDAGAYFLNQHIDLASLLQGYAPDAGEMPASVEPDPGGGGAARVMAWLEQGRAPFHVSESATCGGFEARLMGNCGAILFPKSLDDDRLFGAAVDEEDFWSKVVFGLRDGEGNLLDEDGAVIETREDGWPDAYADLDRVAPDYDYDDVVQGDWRVDAVTWTDETRATLHLTLDTFKGHAFFFSLCGDAFVSLPPVVPAIFNIESAHFTLDVEAGLFTIEESPAQNEQVLSASSCDEEAAECALRVVIDPAALSGLPDVMGSGAFLEASKDCTDTVTGNGNGEGEYDPLGCHVHQDGADFYELPDYLPLLLETRTGAGSSIAMSVGPSYSYLLEDTLRGQLRYWCGAYD